MSTEMKCQGRSRELEALHVIRERRSRLVTLPRTFRGTLHTLKAGVEIHTREIAMCTTYQNIYAYIRGAPRDTSNETAAHCIVSSSAWECKGSKRFLLIRKADLCDTRF